ncbi:MAG: leucyl-tRNA synthetase [Candidatus Paceibacteria bacterium]|jgi:leucyl-tRNA synthetase
MFMHKRFKHNEIEEKWQTKWKTDKLYRTTNNSAKPKAYVLDMFPYPSGEGLHVGHPKGYIATDIYSRFKRMTGHEVLHPMGFDAFGLPAENYAIKNKVHPREAVETNVARFKEQLEVLGFDYDWDREVNTTDPEYYKWTQWIFIQLFKKGLAYESYEPINWCPGCQTGLANEDLEADGTCERCDSVVEKRPMRQWVLKIREYADRMLEDLNTLDWPEHIKEAQRNWIGRSEGAEIDFELSVGEKLSVFTTRPDTLYGATYMVIAPEHKLVQKYKEQITNWTEVDTYITEVKDKKEMDRLDDTKEKTGVKLEGITATNPASGEEIPVYIADYVLASYGTGAIMAVPAHDERDNAFAKKFGIHIKQVVTTIFNHNSERDEKVRRGVYALLENDDDEYLIQQITLPAKNGDGAFYWLPGGGVNEGENDTDTLKREVLEETGYLDFCVKEKITRVLYDYSDGAPRQGRKVVDVYHVKLKSEKREEIQLDEDEIKWGLESQWVKKSDLQSTLKNGSPERSKLIQFVVDVHNGLVSTQSGELMNSEKFDEMTSKEAGKAIVEKVGGRMTTTYKIKDWVFSRQRYWGEPIPIIHCEKCGPVAVPESELPLVLPEVENYEPAGDGQSPLSNIDEWVNTTCPACNEPAKRETNTMPQWAGSSWYYLRYMDPNNDKALVSKENEKYWAPVDVYVGGDHAVRHLIYARFWHKFLYDINVVSTIEPFQRLEFLGFILAEDGRKMSKRWGNVINPDDIVKLVGADTLRVYEMFMGPFENVIAWSQDGLAGSRRFLERVYGLSQHIQDEEPKEVTTLLHKTIKKVTDDIEGFKFNTAISAMMILLNQAEKTGISKEGYRSFLKFLAPFAPHLTEELWAENGNMTSVHTDDWPVYISSLAQDDVVTIGVQINGKMRGEISISPKATQVEAMEEVGGNQSLLAKFDSAKIKKIIYVQGRIINLII